MVKSLALTIGGKLVKSPLNLFFFDQHKLNTEIKGRGYARQYACSQESMNIKSYFIKLVYDKQSLKSLLLKKTLIGKVLLG